MRPLRSLPLALVLVTSSLFAQTRPVVIDPQRPQGPKDKCCATKVYDATGKLIGDVIRWDDRFQSIQLHAWVRYSFKGDDVALLVSPESFQGSLSPGGSTALFTTPDCSGNQMFAMLQYPPLTRRYGVVLLAGNPSSLMFTATNAWLFVTDPLPARVSPGSTVFRSQWTEQGACSPYPAPGYVVSGTPVGGFWMTRVEDLYTKFKRPFWSQ